MTGHEIVKAEPWYPKQVRGLRTRSGAPVGLECETHPDPVADACRWQICEGELMQAIGRGRGVNRTAADPLDIDIIANVVLPLTVDVAEPWNPPGEEIEMQIEGVVLDSASDMAAAWPAIWATPMAARHWVHRRAGDGHTVPNPYKNSLYIEIRNGVEFRYQRAGARQKWRTGIYDPAVVPDLRAWLETRLGPLAGFHIDETAAPAAGPAPSPASGPLDGPPWLHAAAYGPDLVARFRLVAEVPADTRLPPPVKAEIVRFDPAAPIHADGVYAQLLDGLSSGDLAEVCRRYPPMTIEERQARRAADLAAGGAQTFALAAVLASQEAGRPEVHRDEHPNPWTSFREAAE